MIIIIIIIKLTNINLEGQNGQTLNRERPLIQEARCVRFKINKNYSQIEISSR